MTRIQARKKLLGAEGPMDLAVDFKIDQGEFVSLFGKSGAGKTTVLRMIAGLTQPDEGYIEVDGAVWFDSQQGVNLPPQKRPVGFVFQEYSLFPNMTVRENLEYALSKKADKGRVDEWLALMQLKEIAGARPGQLSGGQKQRVALIRALLRKPKIYLLDEPLAAVDMAFRQKLQDEIVRFCRDSGIATIFVSHNLAEVFKLASRVFVLEAGRIIKTGIPAEIFAEKNISGKFKFVGEIAEIRQDQGVYILTVLVGNSPIRVVVTAAEMEGLSVGSKIVVASKAFNPIIMKHECLPVSNPSC